MRLPAQPFAHQGGMVILAHRGFSARYPENTLLAFDKAAELPIDGLEMDVHATRDDVLVVSHDATVTRMTGAPGAIAAMTLAQIQALDAGYTFSPDGGQTFPFRAQGLTIPTFAEVLARFPQLWINVDIKHHEPRVVDLFCDLIRRHDASARVCAGSFSAQTVMHFRQSCPRATSLATEAEIARLFVLSKLRLERFFPSGAHPIQIPPRDTRLGITFDIVSRRFIQAAHRQRMAVHLWTINERADMRRYAQMGVDGIITDYPDRALEHLRPAQS